MSPIKWFKNHLIITMALLLLMVWGGGKLWSYIQYRYFKPVTITHVETIVLAPRIGTNRWQSVGTVKAAHDILLGSEISGTIDEIHVTSGQTVKAGEILLTIRHADKLAELQKDQAVLTHSKLNYERQQHLLKANATSTLAVNEAESAYTQAKAAVAAGHALLAKYQIKAPFTGQVGIWQVQTGQLVQTGATLVSLTNNKPAYIDFTLPAKSLGLVAVGDTVRFTTSSYEKREWTGKIAAIEPQLDSATRSVILRAEVANEDGKLVPRLYGKVVLVRPTQQELYVPQEAIIYDPKGTSVYILQDKMAQLKTVVLGAHDGDHVVVTNGLQAGDEVVTAGMMKLFPGTKVVVNKQIKQA